MSQETLNEIKSCSQKAADAVRECLIKSDLEAYKKFLNQMYHYTLKSGDKIISAAKKAPTSELKDFFNHMYSEECNHYMLAVQDLKGFGLTPTSDTPQEIEEFNQFWETLGKGHFNGYLGALYVFENIADKVSGEVRDLLIRLGVNEKQRRWLSIHVEADEEHGRLSGYLLEKHLAENQATALEAAKRATKLWIAIVTTPFAECLKQSKS